jgi:hypothetical protein
VLAVVTLVTVLAVLWWLVTVVPCACGDCVTAVVWLW